MVTFVAGSLVVDSLAHQKKILRKQLVLSWSLKAVFFGVLTRRDGRKGWEWSVFWIQRLLNRKYL